MTHCSYFSKEIYAGGPHSNHAAKVERDPKIGHKILIIYLLTLFYRCILINNSNY